MALETSIVIRAKDLATGRIEVLRSSFRLLEGSIRSTGRAMTRLSSILARTTAIGGLGGLLGGLANFKFGKEIVTASSNLEQMSLKLKALTGSSKEAEKSVNFLLGIASDIPVRSLDTYTKAFVKLRAVGIDPTNGSLRSLIDASTAFGSTDEEFLGAVNAIQQIASKGVVAMEELRGQLAERFPTAIKILAKELNLSTQELFKLIEQRGLDANTALTALFKGFSREFDGTAAQMQNTWKGAVANLKIQWERFLITAGQTGVFQKAKNFVNEIAELLKSRRNELVGLFDATIKVISFTFRQLLGGRDIKNGFLGFLKEAIKLSSKIVFNFIRGGLTLNHLFKSLASILKASFNTTRKFLLFINRELAEAFTDIFQMEGLKNDLGRLRKDFDALRVSLDQSFDKASRNIFGVSDKVKNTFGKLDQAIGSSTSEQAKGVDKLNKAIDKLRKSQSQKLSDEKKKVIDLRRSIVGLSTDIIQVGANINSVIPKALQNLEFRLLRKEVDLRAESDLQRFGIGRKERNEIQRFNEERKEMILESLTSFSPEAIKKIKENEKILDAISERRLQEQRALSREFANSKVREKEFFDDSIGNIKKLILAEKEGILETTRFAKEMQSIKKRDIQQSIRDLKNQVGLSPAEEEIVRGLKTGTSKRDTGDRRRNRQLAFLERALELIDELEAAKLQNLEGPRTFADAWSRSIRKVQNEFASTMNNLQQITDNLVSGIQRSLETAIGNFFFDVIEGRIRKLKDILKDFLNGIARSIAQILSQQLAVRTLSLFLPGSTPKLANGGIAQRNKAHLVGEQGPELFIPGRTGRVIPNKGLAKLSKSTQVNIEIKNQTGTPVQAKQEFVRDEGSDVFLGIVLNALGTNKMGFRDAVKVAAT